MKGSFYICCDLKSFYASVECVERGLDPMTARLVVADPERTEKTICLAVTPAMKALGVKNRCRIFEIPPGIEYITAPPRMKKYIDYAAVIYGVYLSFISKDDIHVYSIDEAFIDVTHYLELYRMNARQLAETIMREIYEKTGIRAACGIGTNLYLAKIALDITAKHSDDFIGFLDEESYRKTLWEHRPLTDFWRIGRGISERLERCGIFTMGDIARSDEETLYRRFGIDAELLIDHAWGRESATIADIKAYVPKENCLTGGQVLMRDYNFEEGELIVKEMTDALCLEMAAKGLAAESVTLNIGYSRKCGAGYSHATARLDAKSNAGNILIPLTARLYERTADRRLAIKRINITFNRVAPEAAVQCSIFDGAASSDRERSLQKAVVDIKRKYGKNSVLRAISLEKAATARERNMQIGGHKSGE